MRIKYGCVYLLEYHLSYFMVTCHYSEAVTMQLETYQSIIHINRQRYANSGDSIVYHNGNLGVCIT